MSKKKTLNSKDLIYKRDYDKYQRTPETIQEEDVNPEDIFGDTGTDAQSNPAKELFNPKNPKIKSEFTDREILIMCRLYEKSKIYYEPHGNHTLKNVLNELVLLRISKDRGSRHEFVDTHREAMKMQKENMFTRMFQGNNNM